MKSDGQKFQFWESVSDVHGVDVDAFKVYEKKSNREAWTSISRKIAHVLFSDPTTYDMKIANAINCVQWMNNAQIILLSEITPHDNSSNTNKTKWLDIFKILNVMEYHCALNQINSSVEHTTSK